MSYIGNSPEDAVVLRLQARKSFALGMWIQDSNKNPLDITGCTLRLVVRKRVDPTVVDDTANLVANSNAIVLAPTLGYARFDLQASDTDYAPGEYSFSIVLLTPAGYSSTIVNGILDLQQNTEFTSVSSAYPPGQEMATSLEVALRGLNTLEIRTGQTLAPGAATFTSAMEVKLLQMFAGAVAAGTTLSADDIADGMTKVIMTQAERTKLADLEITWDSITNKPDFGDIITHDTSEFILKEGVNATSDIKTGVIAKERVPNVSELRGIVVTTGAPVAGFPGRITLKYTP